MPLNQNAPRSVDQLDEMITRPNEAVLAPLQRCPGDFIVLGAGGKMGFHLSRMLQRSLQQLGRNDSLTAVSRFSAPASRQPFERFGLNTVAADLSDPNQVGAVPLADNVFYLAGIKFGTAGDSELLRRMNSVMPALVAERFAASRIVALSTGCVYSFTSPESGGSTEESEMRPPGEYARSCLDREQAFFEASRRHRTPCALVRLNYSIDLRYGVLVDIAQQVKAGQPIDVSTGYVNVIWQADALAQIIQCVAHAVSPPFVINITGSETLRVRDVARRFGRHWGCVPTFQGSEAETCWLSNNALARKLFGEPETSVDRMVDWIAQWLDRGGQTLGKPTHFQNRDGNY
jgi:nucleoside-diphosphate-sugar epimerase